MTDAALETQVMRLARGLMSFREADVFAALRAETQDAREALRAVLRDLAARARLVCRDGRYSLPRGV